MVWVPLTSAIIALGVFLTLHFFIEPKKEKRRVAQEKLEKLYGPLYALISARYYVAGRFMKEVSLGSIKEHAFLTKDYMDEFFLQNSGYASPKLISVWAKYAANSRVETDLIHELIETVVKEYNELRRFLNLEYDNIGLETGMPHFMKQV